MAKYVGELEETYSALWRKRVRRFGENVFSDLEKTCLVILAKTYSVIFGDNASSFWRNRSTILEKTVRR